MIFLDTCVWIELFGVQVWITLFTAHGKAKVQLFAAKFYCCRIKTGGTKYIKNDSPAPYMNTVIMGHLGSDAVDANSVANIVKNIIACVCLGIGTGILVGNELGSGNLETAKKYGSLLCKISLITGAVSGLFILLSSPLVLMFTTSLTEQAHAYLQIMLYICSYYMIGTCGLSVHTVPDPV